MDLLELEELTGEFLVFGRGVLLALVIVVHPGPVAIPDVAVDQVSDRTILAVDGGARAGGERIGRRAIVVVVDDVADLVVQVRLAGVDPAVAGDEARRIEGHDKVSQPLDIVGSPVLVEHDPVDDTGAVPVGAHHAGKFALELGLLLLGARFEGARHVLPHEQAGAIALGKPAARLHLDVLADHVETPGLDALDVEAQRLVGRVRVKSVGSARVARRAAGGCRRGRIPTGREPRWSVPETFLLGAGEILVRAVNPKPQSLITFSSPTFHAAKGPAWHGTCSKPIAKHHSRAPA